MVSPASLPPVDVNITYKRKEMDPTGESRKKARLQLTTAQDGSLFIEIEQQRRVADLSRNISTLSIN